MPLVQSLVDALGRASWADRVAGPVDAAVRPLVRTPAVRNALNGTWLGHPVHPMLVVAPIGAWLAAAALDAGARGRADEGAQRLVGLGNVAAVPTAMTGLAQWVDLTGPARRVGVVHAAANTVALAAHVVGWLARRRGRADAGRAWGAAGLAAVGVGGFLGGHLSYVYGVGVDHTAFDTGPDDWTRTGVRGEAVPAEGFVVGQADGRHLLVSRSGAGFSAVAATCTHMGAPLQDAAVEEGCLTCPWHGSRFRLDGEVVLGPAVIGLPRYEVRVTDGELEVRARAGSPASAR